MVNGGIPHKLYDIILWTLVLKWGQPFLKFKLYSIFFKGGIKDEYFQLFTNKMNINLR
jgi:hypothetical protein